MRTLNLYIKRLIDIFFSLSGLILLLPIFILTGILIKVTMPGPIFFKQIRVGENRKPFSIIKFRTMKVDKEAEEKTDFSKDKERLTQVGQLLRRTKIDELPQLINVLRGDMSLVGPRPTVLRHVEGYNDFQSKRLDMKPGMTGLAQVNGGNSIPWSTRIVYDIEYVNNFSILLDIKIISKTLFFIIFGEKRYLR